MALTIATIELWHLIAGFAALVPVLLTLLGRGGATTSRVNVPPDRSGDQHRAAVSRTHEKLESKFDDHARANNGAVRSERLKDLAELIPEISIAED